MWRFKPFTHKEQNGLEGRIIDIGNFKVQVRNVIAEGGFSCVYSSRDAIHGSKPFALKHIICNDEESLELAMKEISVMKSLKGHPNVVTYCAHAVFDMGRTKEILLLMECCEKSLVNVLESRGAGFFEEKQVLTIFRDVCNAVFAMHCHSPPIAHRDLKAENLLLGSDGLWKLCDFGSTSTNHKRFEKPEEMGIEEDNIRKYTTPAYRAPELWDLFRRELINEKVDIWALGCLLFRICYFKLAFDGESKLQILNGNYRIPDFPKYNSSLTDLIRDMLQSSPNDRPDITQVWFRVNSLLPEGSQKSLPDGPPEMPQQTTDVLAGMPKPANKSNPMPRRSPPPPPSAGAQNASLVPNILRTGESAGPFGAFWTSEHAKDSVIHEDESRPKYDEDGTNHTLSGHDKICPEKHPASYSTPYKEQNFQSSTVQKSTPGRSVDRPSFENSPFTDDSNKSTERLRSPKPEDAPTFQNDAFNAFVAEFGSNKKSPGTDGQRSEKEEFLGAELKKVREQLAHANTEKAEITSKYEKLSAICRSQRQEIQDLKQALAARTPSPSKDQPSNQSSTTPPNEKIEGTVWELKQGLFDRNSISPDPQQWQAFTDDSRPPTLPPDNTPKSVRTRNGQQSKKPIEPSSSTNAWGFGSENFKADPSDTSKINVPMRGLSKSQRFGESKSVENKLNPQPAGWAGF
ncbi:uncharacterized protein [Primulina eburnea]|uniref:uncharacterized protein n=1 Tax=Primulina eburnea TaxID=1245227 RepID=UPI003C6C16D6